MHLDAECVVEVNMPNQGLVGVTDLGKRREVAAWFGMSGGASYPGRELCRHPLDLIGGKVEFWAVVGGDCLG